MYHKLFTHFHVCFWRELSYGAELFIHKNTILPLVDPLTASHMSWGSEQAFSPAAWAAWHVDRGEDIEKTSCASPWFPSSLWTLQMHRSLSSSLGQAVHNRIHLVNRRTSHLSAAKNNYKKNEEENKRNLYLFFHHHWNSNN